MRLVLLFVPLVLLGCRSAPDTPPDPGPEAAAPTVLPTVCAYRDSLGEPLDPLLTAAGLETTLKFLTKNHHPSGSPADQRNLQQIAQRLRLAGLEIRIEESFVVVPRPIESGIEMLTPQAFRASFVEHPLDADFDTHSEGLLPFFAWCPDAEVEGPLHFCGRATPRDFAELRASGVPLEGAIGIARRVGELLPAWQLRQAAEAGLAGLILYNDPADDGYGRGDPYPSGPWRPASAVSPGCLLDPRRPGDPQTPGRPAPFRAQRIPLDAITGVPPIPALPLSHEEARPLLAALKGAVAPASWRGGLPISYHLGNGGVRLRLRTRTAWEPRRIRNLIATLRGSAFPRERIYLGASRASWTHGASSGASATAQLLEVASALGALARRGLRPSRSLVFCFFDGGPEGDLGAMEFVDAHRDRITASARAYLEVAAADEGLRIAASPLLSNALLPLANAKLTPLRTRGSPGIFQAQLGVPSLVVGRTAPSPVAGSHYDTFGWLKRFGDPGFVRHEAQALAIARLAWWAAEAPIAPFDFRPLGRTIEQATRAWRSSLSEKDALALNDAVRSLTRSADAWNEAAHRRLAEDPDPTHHVETNAALRAATRRLTSGPVEVHGRHELFAWDDGGPDASPVHAEFGRTVLPEDAPLLARARAFTRTLQELVVLIARAQGPTPREE